MNAKLDMLNAASAKNRLEALEKLIKTEPVPEVFPQYANNHIHTFYSFSPYSPTAAVYYARAAGLETAGIMDHDSIAGAKEFLQAAEIAGIKATCGIECRVSLKGTPITGKTTNNPDQADVSYLALHGIPHDQIDVIDNHFKPLREKRNDRNKKIIENINRLTAVIDIELDFDNDVVPLSKYNEGGTITERHLMYALAKKIILKGKKGEGSISLLEKIGVSLSEKQKGMLLDINNPFYEYDMLGFFKSGFIPKVYVPATEELMTVAEFSELAKKTNALLVYPYLGDVTDSVTGDKKAQKFEDEYLDELFAFLQSFPFDAIAYMPSRNTTTQLERLQQLCEKHGFFEISGEDINTPRQSFICKELANDMFKHLIDATHSLIEYENNATKGVFCKPKRK